MIQSFCMHINIFSRKEATNLVRGAGFGTQREGLYSFEIGIARSTNLFVHFLIN